MKAATKGNLYGLLVGAVVWALTGFPALFVLAAAGAAATWVHSTGPRPLVRVVIREGVLEQFGTELACYDYGGCQWRGDGCKGRPLVLEVGLQEEMRTHRLPGHIRNSLRVDDLP